VAWKRHSDGERREMTALTQRLHRHTHNARTKLARWVEQRAVVSTAKSRAGVDDLEQQRRVKAQLRTPSLHNQKCIAQGQ
jgi:hypothetical protein